MLNASSAFYNAADAIALAARALDICAGAVFGPVFRYCGVFDEIADFGCFRRASGDAEGRPKD